MRKYILIIVVAMLSSITSMAQFTVEHNDGSKTEIEGNVTFSSDNTTGDFSIGDTYSEFNTVANIKALYRTPKTYTIEAVPGEDYYYFSAPDKAKAGEIVEFEAVVTDLYYKISEVAFGTGEGDKCELVEETLGQDSKIYTFRFTMPAYDVSLKALTEQAYYRIYRKGDDHSQVIMINSIAKDEDGNELVGEDGEVICQNLYNSTVYFDTNTEIGFDNTISVTGDLTGNPVNIMEESSPGYGDFWKFYMSAEAVTISTQSVERSAYNGKPFTGDYKGFFINTTRYSDIYQSDGTTMDMTLKGNTVFTVKSEDENNYDFKGTYTFDEAVGKFDYVSEECDEFGLSGIWGEDFTLAIIRNIDPEYDLPENNRFYITTKKPVSGYTAASDQGGNRNLMQFTCDGAVVYYLFSRDNYSLSEVTLTYGSGSSISENGVMATVYDGVTPIFRYEVKDNKPVFTDKGKEAGTYTGDSGTLVLDGFGKATISDKEGTYTIEGSVVTLTVDGITTTYIIDTVTGTYTITDTDVWDGDSYYEATGDFGYDGEPRKAKVSVTIVDGNKAEFSSMVENEFGEMKQEVTVETVNYVYDAGNATLTLSQVLQGKNGAWGSERSDIVFSVAPDKHSITFTQDRIYSVGTPERYIDTKDLTLTSESAVAAPKVGDYYYSDGTWSDGGLISIDPDGLNPVWAENKPAPVEGKTVIGIVFQTDPSRMAQSDKDAGYTHGYVMAAKMAHGPEKYTTWYTSESSFECLKAAKLASTWYNNVNGRSETQTVLETYGNNMEVVPAFDWMTNSFIPAPESSSGWFLPSTGQAWDMIANLCGGEVAQIMKTWQTYDYDATYYCSENVSYDVVAEINKTLELVPEADRELFMLDENKTYGGMWTSTPYDEESFNIINIGTDGLVELMTNWGNAEDYARPILAF